MNFSQRIQSLSPEKRQLLEALLEKKRGKFSRNQNPYVAPRNQTEAALVRIWEQVLGITPVGIQDHFFELGGDSIQCIQIVAKARQEGIQLTNNQLFEHPRIAELATVTKTISAKMGESKLVEGPVILTPIQHWFFEQNYPEPQHWNQAVLLELPQDLNPVDLKRAFQHLITHHDALRLRFQRRGESWQQFNGGEEEVSFSEHDLSRLSGDEQMSAIERSTSQLQMTLDLSEGPLFKAAHFDLGTESPARLFLLAHHLTVDGLSFRLLLEDLQAVYQQIQHGEPIHLPPKTSSFQEWALGLDEYARTRQLREEFGYWEQELRRPAPPLPLDFSDGTDDPDGRNTEESARVFAIELSEEETRRLLREVPVAGRVHVNEVLLTALALAISRWTEESSLIVDLEGHGREEILQGLDVSRTVGWLTSLFPVSLEVASWDKPVEALRAIKEKVRRVPNRGIGFGLLRYSSKDPEISRQLSKLPRAQILFNYLGQFDQQMPGAFPLRLAHEPYGTLYSPKGLRPHLLQLVAGVMEGRLQVSWIYSENLHQYKTIEYLVSDFKNVLHRLIDDCSSGKSAPFTPADFPESELSPAELDRLLSAHLRPKS
jgi:non-ribosomal peptide synthase protein (TIGR01720 family)